MAGYSSYTVSETLLRQQDAVVYRAVDRADGKRVLLKTLGSRHGPKDVLRLKREHEMGWPLESTAILRTIALATVEGMPVLVCEDFGGLPLARLIGEPIGVERFLELAIHIVTAVAALHRERAVHKDLKPENIYVHPTTGEVKLTGLGLASRLPRELTAVQPPLLIEGSLPYLSPEQTGRVARAIDSRSDLYSLGVVFYQLLTGRFPFQAKDALEWIYCHVARVPPSPRVVVPTLPLPLAAMVQKLLAKMPEDRYQTARGLVYDLERCAAGWRRHGSIGSFALGKRDVADEPRVPDRLYGREREVSALLGAFERVVSSGAAELLLVTGPPGVGKSALVAELRQPALRERGLFLSGKFDQQARDIPYSTLVQAFTRLVLDLLAQDEEHRSAWKGPLRQALGIEARLIVDVIPPLRLLLGEPPPLVEVPLLDAEPRFRRVFLDFLGVFTRPEHSLVLFLDDLQWADAASLRLLEEAVTAPDTHHLLLVGAYRQNEVDPPHPLVQMLERIRKTSTPVSEVALAPFGMEDVLTLLADTVRSDRERVRPLAAVVCAKTAGNPFFVLQFLSVLHQERLLWLDEHSLTWRWDIARIEARGYTDNVIDFMLQRLTGLSAATQSALTVAACIGNECELPILALVYGKSEEETCRDLCEALDAGLILQTRGQIAFVHDRVQQAAYALLEPARRTRMHLQVGRLLFEQTPAERMQDRLFEIVTQLDLGLSFVADEPERLRIAELNLRAGRKAKAASAYEFAARYLAVGQALLPTDAWEHHYELTYGLCLERARCEALSQRLEVAFQLIAELLRHARTAVDQLEVAALRIDLAVIRQDPAAIDENVLIAIEACSKWLGVKLTPHPSEAELRHYVEETLQELGDRSIEDIARLPEMTDPAVKAGVDMLSKAMPSAYNLDLGLHDLMSATIVRLSLRHGNSEISPHGYSTFGGALGRLLERWDDAYRFGQVAATVVEQRGPAASPGRGSSHFTTGVFINGWTRPLREVIPLLRRAFEAARECGDVNVASFSSLVIVEYCFSAGESLAEVAAEAERQLEYTRHVRQYIQDYVESMLLLVRRLRGQTPPAPGIDDESEAARKPQHPWLLFQHQTCRAIEYLIFGDYRSAAAVAESYRTLAHMGSAADVALAWYVAALAYACHFDDASPDERVQLRQRLADLEEQHRVWEKRCAETFRNRRALISAETARIDGRDADAIRLYEEAITAARKDGFVQNEAIASELAARFCRMRGLPTVTDAYLQHARACYHRWGAEAKVDQLDRLHASLRPPEASGPTATLAVRPEQLDLLSVLKASQTISSEIELDKLVRTLLETVLMQSGAQRAALVFSRAGKLFVEAQAELEPSGLSTSTPRGELSDGSSSVPVSLLRYVELTRERVIIDDDVAKSPVADEYLLRVAPCSALCLPILKQRKVLGFLYLENRLLAGTFTPGRLAAVEVLATQSAISVENALLLAAERTARAAAEAAEYRAALLSEASARLSESLDYSAQLIWLSRFCVRSLADWCVIDILEGPHVVPAAGAHREATKEPILHALQQTYPPHSGSPHPAATVLCTGEPLLIENIPDTEMRRLCVDDEHARLLAVLGSRSAVFVPMVARGQVLGALSLLAATAGHFGRNELELAQDLAGRAAVAIDNARLYQASQEAVRLRQQVEAQLVQAQKMESIGRLAGGVAHDFNNLLTVISGSLELGLVDLPPDHPARSHLADVANAAESAAGLTRQLLAFSRMQTIAPTVVDLNEVIRRVGKMILRLLGEDVMLETICAHDLKPICFDPGQVEQIIVNLAVNARDAMTNGGRLTIRTSNAYLDEKYARSHVDVKPGAYALLEVSDTGTGMTEEVRAHLFEPFFTTKDIGKGTGLGLATVYGAVRQNGGHIDVHSEVGKGSMFKVYLPAATGVASATPPAPAAAIAQARGASILLVEDDDAVRGFAVSALMRFGHEVHAFASGEDALAALSSLSPTPKLLITDLTMPGMNGRVLAEHVAARLPNIRVLFVSGYPQDVVAEGTSKAGIEFLAKPYSVDQLARRASEVLARMKHATGV